MTTPETNRTATSDTATGPTGRQPGSPGANSDLATLLDGAMLAAQLAITERHVRRLVAERLIPFIKVGRFVRFDPVAGAKWLERATVEVRR